MCAYTITSTRHSSSSTLSKGTYFFLLLFIHLVFACWTHQTRRYRLHRPRKFSSHIRYRLAHWVKSVGKRYMVRTMNQLVEPRVRKLSLRRGFRQHNNADFLVHIGIRQTCVWKTRIKVPRSLPIGAVIYANFVKFTKYVRSVPIVALIEHYDVPLVSRYVDSLSQHLLQHF